MKNKATYILVFLLSGISVFAQVAINTDGSSPDNSAMLDVKSTNKGFLPSRMTTAQINGIVNPAEGLIVYNSTIHSPVFYDGTGWKTTNGYYIGASYGGGIIFYIDSTGQHGLISATTDQTPAPWGCFGFSISGTSTAIGKGQTNTTLIVNGCATAGIAARICNDLVLNGYSDWFLPSKDELNQMYVQRNAIGNFLPSDYLSSSEVNANYAWGQGFNNGGQNNDHKAGTDYVRAVRAF